MVRCLRRFATLLSLREQQLLAFLHILLEAPRYVFLERVGAVLGSDEVQKILQLLGESSITSINIGAADERRDLCDATLECIEDGGWSWTTNLDESRVAAWGRLTLALSAHSAPFSGYGRQCGCVG